MRALILLAAIAVSTAFHQSAHFPSIDEIIVASFTAGVQVTDVAQEVTSYATEYYSYLDKRGSVEIYIEGNKTAVYYDNETFQITEVVWNNCTVNDADISDYYYNPIFEGWLNKDPIVIGPSAALWYAQERKDLIKGAGTETIRDIKCDKFVLPVQNKRENLTIEYFFSSESWISPFQFGKLRTPIRIRISGTSSRNSANTDNSLPVDLINDFVYFKPTIDDFNNLIPPIGLGCRGRKETDVFPRIPKVFQYSAEVVDLLRSEEQLDIEIHFEKTWYDNLQKLARVDRFTIGEAYRSNLYDFNTATAYETVDFDSCKMKTLHDVEFLDKSRGMMVEPAEALNLDGTFYDMGRREIRGQRCGAYESVKFDVYFNNTKYHKLVTTVCFAEPYKNADVIGEPELRRPIYMLINGYSTPGKKTLQLQYNIFEFNDISWPEMYSSFKLESCFKAESKAHFVLKMEVPPETAAVMEDQDGIITLRLKNQISKYAKAHEMRFPFLKLEYNSSEVNARGVLLERPPALLQFYELDSGPIVTHDPYLKVISEAGNLEQCSYACVDEGDFLCKGFYFCNKVCFLKSTDPFDEEDDGPAMDLGVCTEYMRAVRESTNFRQAYLVDALENLKTAVLNKRLTVDFMHPGDFVEIIVVKDFIVDGTNTGIDTRDSNFSVSVEFRKLDYALDTTKRIDNARTLNDCYRRCKAAGSLCSSFSFCPDSPKDDKECMISSNRVVKGLSKDWELVPDRFCNIYNPISAPSACLQAKVVGSCKGHFERYFFNQETGKCEQFIYGGCNGNANNFSSQEDCEAVCRA